MCHLWADVGCVICGQMSVLFYEYSNNITLFLFCYFDSQACWLTGYGSRWLEANLLHLLFHAFAFQQKNVLIFAFIYEHKKINHLSGLFNQWKTEAGLSGLCTFLQWNMNQNVDYFNNRVSGHFQSQIWIPDIIYLSFIF